MLFEQLETFAINYLQYKCARSLIQKYFRNSFGTLVFIHTQIVNQTAFVVC